MQHPQGKPTRDGMDCSLAEAFVVFVEYLVSHPSFILFSFSSATVGGASWVCSAKHILPISNPFWKLTS
jgi:hypothetical protein